VDFAIKYTHKNIRVKWAIKEKNQSTYRHMCVCIENPCLDAKIFFGIYDIFHFDFIAFVFSLIFLHNFYDPFPILESFLLILAALFSKWLEIYSI
jgi:hypothetical protein